MKGQKSRSGVSGLIGFEGGQIPLTRRIPKRGFRHTQFDHLEAVINLKELDARFEANAAVSPKALYDLGLIKKSEHLKVLGGGELSKVLNVQAHAFSASAKTKIEKAGGKIEILKK